MHFILECLLNTLPQRLQSKSHGNPSTQFTCQKRKVEVQVRGRVSSKDTQCLLISVGFSPLMWPQKSRRASQWELLARVWHSSSLHRCHLLGHKAETPMERSECCDILPLHEAECWNHLGKDTDVWVLTTLQVSDVFGLGCRTGPGTVEISRWF